MEGDCIYWCARSEFTRRAAVPHGTAQRQADPVLQGRQLQPHPAAKVLYVLTLRANSQLISSCTQRQRLASCGGPSSWWHSFGFQSPLRGKMSLSKSGPSSTWSALSDFPALWPERRDRNHYSAGSPPRGEADLFLLSPRRSCARPWPHTQLLQGAMTGHGATPSQTAVTGSTEESCLSFLSRTASSSLSWISTPTQRRRSSNPPGTFRGHPAWAGSQYRRSGDGRVGSFFRLTLCRVSCLRSQRDSTSCDQLLFFGPPHGGGLYLLVRKERV